MDPEFDPADPATFLCLQSVGSNPEVFNQKDANNFISDKNLDKENPELLAFRLKEKKPS